MRRSAALGLGALLTSLVGACASTPGGSSSPVVSWDLEAPPATVREAALEVLEAWSIRAQSAEDGVRTEWFRLPDDAGYARCGDAEWARAELVLTGRGDGTRLYIHTEFRRGAEPGEAPTPGCETTGAFERRLHRRILERLGG